MSSSAAAPQLLPKAAPQAQFAFSFGVVFRFLSICLQISQNQFEQLMKTGWIPLPCKQVLGWVTSQNFLLAQFSAQISLKFHSWEIRGSGEVPSAFPFCWALTVDARKTGAGAFYTGILYHLEIPCETFLMDNTSYFLLDLGRFLQLYPWVLFLVLLQSLKGVVSLLLC